MDDFLFDLKEMNVEQTTADAIVNNQESDASEEQTATPNNEQEQNVDTSIDIDENGQQVNTGDEAAEEGSDDVDINSSQEENSSSSKSDSSQKSTLYALAQHLKEEGLLFHDEELGDIKTLDDLKELVKTSNEKAQYANLNESQKRYQDALKSGIPIKEFEKVEKEIQTFSQIKDEELSLDANLRFEVLAIDLMNQGLSKEKAIKVAKISVQDESSVQDAKEALENIRKFKKEQFTNLVNEGKQTKEMTINEVKKSVFDRESLLDTKLNDMTKNKLFDLITNQVDADEEGRPLNELQKWQRENPLESSVLLNYLFLMTNKGKDMSLMKKAGVSTASKDLEKRLQGMTLGEDGTLNIPDAYFSGDSKKQANGDNAANSKRNNFTINI